MNISRYVSLSAIDKDIVVFEDLKELIHQLSKLGNNLNQLTVLAHQERIKEVNVKEAMTLLKEIWETLDRLTK